MHLPINAVTIGLAATLAIDLWATFTNRVLGWPRTNWAMVGRWIGHMRQGQFMHASIESAAPIGHESIIGWAFHYVVGCIYAVLYVTYVGFIHAGLPTLMSSIVFGWFTVLSPWLLMQPALGLGVGAHRAKEPALVRLQNLTIHTIFGLALYLSYKALDSLAGQAIHHA